MDSINYIIRVPFLKLPTNLFILVFSLFVKEKSGFYGVSVIKKSQNCNIGIITGQGAENCPF